jgi:hypothetical protein
VTRDFTSIRLSESIIGEKNNGPFDSRDLIHFTKRLTKDRLDEKRKKNVCQVAHWTHEFSSTSFSPTKVD